MKYEELDVWEDKLMREVVRRRALGAYNTDAPSILLALESQYEIVRHLRENTRRPKPKTENEAS